MPTHCSNRVIQNDKSGIDICEISSGDCMIRILGLDGAVIYEGSKISLISLSSGIYIKQEIKDNGKIKTSKIIIK